MTHDQDHLVSTGRGGQGNIGKDPNVYVPGDIVREGHDGDGVMHSTGRGGAGNIGSPSMNPVSDATANAQHASSEDFIPETAMRTEKGYENFHTGRGGGGNVHREKFGGHSNETHTHTHEKPTLTDKVKHIIGADKKHDGA